MSKIKQVRETKKTARQIAEEQMAKYSEVYNRRAAMQAEMKERVQEIQSEYSEDLTQMDTQLETLEAELNIFAESHPDEFAGKKSLKLECGTIGWRLDMGKLIYGDDTDMDKLKKMIEKELPDALDVKIDSKKVISACKIIGKLPVKLEKLGVIIQQNDKFFVTANKQ